MYSPLNRVWSVYENLSIIKNVIDAPNFSFQLIFDNPPLSRVWSVYENLSIIKNVIDAPRFYECHNVI